jgi:hypothetical protein
MPAFRRSTEVENTLPWRLFFYRLPRLERRDYPKIPAQSIVLMLCDEKTCNALYRRDLVRARRLLSQARAYGA